MNQNAGAAKARLREVQLGSGVVSLLRQHPFATLLVAASAGCVAARVPRHELATYVDLLMQLLPDAEEAESHQGSVSPR